MKQDIEVASRIEREKVIQELHVAYKMHKDPKHYIISSAAIQKYAVPLFKAGAEWQAKQMAWINVNNKMPEDGIEVDERTIFAHTNIERSLYMNEKQVCSECKLFANEDSFGNGWCEFHQKETFCENVACEDGIEIEEDISSDTDNDDNNP